MKFWVTLVAAETKLTKEIVRPQIPRSMPKRAIIMEIECANFGKINNFSRLPMALIMPFDLLS